MIFIRIIIDFQLVFKSLQIHRTRRQTIQNGGRSTHPILQQVTQGLDLLHPRRQHADFITLLLLHSNELRPHRFGAESLL